MSDTHLPVLVRMTTELKHELQRQSAINGRTLTGEINTRLRQTLNMFDGDTKTKSSKSLADNSIKASENLKVWGAQTPSETEHVLLALYRKLSPEKQLALLMLLK